MYCIKCGTQLSDSSAFCNKCGAAQGSSSHATAEPAWETSEIVFETTNKGCLRGSIGFGWRLSVLRGPTTLGLQKSSRTNAFMIHIQTTLRQSRRSTT